MAESMESKMSRIFREVFVRAFRDGSEEERQGTITRSRFNAACAKALDVRNTPTNTNIYWGQAAQLGHISFPKPDTLRDELQTFTRARVAPEIWAHDGFILKDGERLQDQIALSIEPKRRRRKETITLEELI